MNNSSHSHTSRSPEKRPFWAAAVLAVALGIGVGEAAPVAAAELQLLAQCQVHAGVVRLGDVAEIYGADPRQADALRAIELFPSPPPGRPRFLPVREVQDLLLLRGIILTEHHFSGSSQVTINGGTTSHAALRLRRRR